MMFEWEDRVRRDPEFACAVDMMYAMAIKHQFTPADLREIAFAAALKYEMTHGFTKLTVQVSRDEYEALRREGFLREQRRTPKDI